MPFRKLMLRLMLWCLGIAAAAGVLAVLMAFDETAWRIIGTMIATAVAAGLMMAMSALSGRKATASAGFVGMGLVLFEWLGTTMLIWEIYRLVSIASWHADDDILGMTMGTLGLAAIWVMIGLLARNVAMTRAAGTFTVVLAIVCAAIVEAAVLMRYADAADEVAETGLILAGFGLLVSIILIDWNWRRLWAIIAILAAVAGAAIAIAAVWVSLPRGSGIFEMILSLPLLGAFCNVVRVVRIPSEYRWMVRTVIILACITTAAIDLAILSSLHRLGLDGVERLAAAGAILTSCGTLALLVLARLSRKDVLPGEMPVLGETIVVCPACRRKARMMPGRSQCAGCGLGIEIKYEEPRCPTCNYLLFMLKSDNCPECGTAIRPRA